MGRDDDEVMFHLGEGCLVHGDEFMRECTMCGIEFCTKCSRGTSVCPDCSEEADEDDEFGDDFGPEEDEDIEGLPDDFEGDEDEEEEDESR